MAAPLDCDVLVVGAGPTGMTLALLLARRGVRTIVLDKEADIYPLPRAAHIDHEIVRIFQELGLAEEILDGCRSSSRYDFLNAQGEVLLRFEGMDRIGPGGWPGGNMVHQPSIEAALQKAARAQNSLDLRRGWTFMSLETTESGALSQVETPERAQRIKSRFVVGADGARSPVRTAAGIGVDDLGFNESWLVIDALVHDATRLPDINLQICDPARPTTCVLMGAGRHRWEFIQKPGESAAQMLDDAFIAGLLAPWKIDGAVTLERKAVYTFGARIADRWRLGPVLLAGDAAHLMPPFAGQGLCSGLRDAANLAWKIAAVCAGADDALLDTYQPEREPNVRAIIATAIMMGRTVCITDQDEAAARDKQMLSARAAGASPDGAPRYPPISTGCIANGASGAGAYFPQPVCGETSARLDDVLGAGPWLISRHDLQATDQLKCVSLDALVLKAFRSRLDKWLDAHNAESVLVRPDKYVFGAGDAKTLQGEWRSKTAPGQRAHLSSQ